MKWSFFFLLILLFPLMALAQAEMVIDLRPGATGSSISNLTVVNDKLFFSAYDDSGHKLFVSDGTADGTHGIYDFPQFQNVYQFDAFGDRLVFFKAIFSGAPTRIYTSNGTTDGTFQLISGDIPNLGRLFMPVTDDYYYFLGGGQPKFYRYDLQKDTSELVTGHQFPDGVNTGFLFLFIGRGQEAWFVGQTAAHGHELRFTDGTFEGTYMIEDLNPGSGSSWPRQVSVFDDEVYFTVSFTHPERVLYRYDRTSQTIHMVKLIQEGADAFHASSAATFFYRLPNGIVLFLADDGIHGTELWRTDGSTQGTFMVKDIREGPTGSMGASSWGGDYFFPVGDGNRVVFGAHDGIHGFEWWTSDGTAEGTQMVIDLREGSSGGLSLSSEDLVLAYNGKVYFVGRTETEGNELWETDGTAEGTRQLTNIRPGTTSAGIQMIRKMGNYLYFRADDGIHGNELWRFNLDGSPTVAESPLYDKKSFLIFPNPASGWVTLQRQMQFEHDTKVEVFDLKGVRVIEQVTGIGEESVRLHVGNLSPGLYLVKWIGEVHKLLVK